MARLPENTLVHEPPGVDWSRARRTGRDVLLLDGVAASPVAREPNPTPCAINLHYAPPRSWQAKERDMPTLATVWADAWRQHLPLQPGELRLEKGRQVHMVMGPRRAMRGAAPEIRAHAHVLCKDLRDHDGCGPNRSIGRVVLPSMHKIDPTLTFPLAIRDTDSHDRADSHVEQTLADLVRRSSPVFQRIAEQYLVLAATRATGKVLGAKDRKERLLTVSTAMVVAGLRIDDVDDAYAYLTGGPRPPSVYGLEVTLNDSELVDELEHLVGRVARKPLHGVCPRPSTGRGTGCPQCDKTALAESLEGFFADATLRYKKKAEDQPSERAATHWNDIVGRADLVARHYDTADAGLVSPARLEQPHPGEALWPVAEVLRRKQGFQDAEPLNWSLEERVHHGLNDKSKGGEDLVGLPEEAELLRREVARSAEVLGIASPLGRALVVAGITLADGFQTNPRIRVPGETAVAARVRGTRAAFHNEWQYARLPHLQNLTEDPARAYVQTLWKRVHGHDLRGSLETDWSSPDRVSDLLAGAMSSSLKRWIRRNLDGEKVREHPVVNYFNHLRTKRVQGRVAALLELVEQDREAARADWETLVQKYPSPPSRGRVPTFDDVLRFLDAAGGE